MHSDKKDLCNPAMVVEREKKMSIEWSPRPSVDWAVEEIGKGLALHQGSLFTRSQSCHFSAEDTGSHRGNLASEGTDPHFFWEKITVVC